MNKLTYAQLGLTVSKSIGEFGAARHDSKVAAMTQKYNNAMQAISTAQSLNAMTENETGVRDAAVRASQVLQLQSLADRAGSTVSAATAGVRGSSVTAAMRGLVRSKLQAQAALKARLFAQGRADLNSRRNLLLGAVYSRDVSLIRPPTAASALLGLGTSVLKLIDGNTPKP